MFDDQFWGLWGHKYRAVVCAIAFASLVWSSSLLAQGPPNPGGGGGGTGGTNNPPIFSSPTTGLKLTVPKAEGTNYRLYVLESIPGNTYEIYFATNISASPSWTLITQGVQTNFLIPKPADPKGWYVGYAPAEIDADRDGSPDEWEVQNGLNRRNNDASADPDGDSFSNAQEYLNGSDPRSAAAFEIQFSSPKAASNIP